MNTMNILYIEDNEDYVQFVKRAVGKVNREVGFDVLTDGKNTIQFIDSLDDSTKVPRLILLDLNLPDYNGLDLLEKIRKNKLTQYTPVVMFSSSENQQDMKKALDCGANAYIVKPVGLTPLAETMQSLCNFWLNHNQPVENFAA